MNDTSANDPQREITNPCPICGHEVMPQGAAFPFCGPRCRLVDLNKWIKGDYMISRPIQHSDLDES